MRYQVHCFDRDGIALPTEDIEAEDDQVAIALVTLRLPKVCELWEGARLVHAKPEKRRCALARPGAFRMLPD